MINLISEINWLAILAALAAYSFLGGLWFTLFFKKSYAASLVKKPDELNNSGMIFILGPMICSLLITITTAILMKALQITTFGGATELAFLVGIGYLVANTVNIAINPNMPRPLFYATISSAFHLTGILIVCTILAAMN